MVAIENVVSDIDVSVSSIGDFNIIILDHMRKMMTVGNIGHFDSAINLAGPEGLEGMMSRTSSLRRTFRLPR